MKFATYDRVVEPVRVWRLNGNKRGHNVNPSITLSILNRYNDEIAPGVSVRVNDPMRFRIALNSSGRLADRLKFVEVFNK